MNRNEYQLFTATTAVFSPSVELHYLTAGLMAEIIEARRAQPYAGLLADQPYARLLAYELGDVCWFCARIAGGCGAELPAPQTAFAGIDRNEVILHYGAYVADIGAKAARDRGARTLADLSPKERENVLECVFTVYALALDLAKERGYTEAQLLQANIDKLNDRKQRGVLSGSGDNR